MSSSPPNAEDRKKCWDARDDYFACLEKNDEEKSKCTELRNLFESDCSKTWVKYFERKRNFEKYKLKLKTDGVQELPEDKEYGKKS